MNMTSLRSGFLLLTILVCLPFVSAEEATTPAAQLKSGDIERFMETFPKMVGDLKKMGSDFGEIESPSMVMAMMANEKVQDVLTRYGWDKEDYVRKLTAIVGGYASVKMDAELAALPEEQRAMVKSMMSSQMPQLLSVHPSDVSLVQQHKAALDTFFKSQ